MFGNYEKRWVRRPMGTKYQMPTVKHGGGSVTVWGYFSASGVGPLVRIDGRMNVNIYREVLEKHVLLFSNKKIPTGWTFQQDNALRNLSALKMGFRLYAALIPPKCRVYSAFFPRLFRSPRFFLDMNKGENIIVVNCRTSKPTWQNRRKMLQSLYWCFQLHLQSSALRLSRSCQLLKSIIFVRMTWVMGMMSSPCVENSRRYII